MNKFRTLVILFSLFTLALSAQDLKPVANPQEFLSKLKEISMKTTSIQADFSEQKFLSVMKEPQVSTGMFYYKKENKLRWEKMKPTQYIFLVNGQLVKIKENGKEQDISSFSPAISKMKDMMLTLVSADFNIDKDYIPSYSENDSIYVVKLIPKNKRFASVIDYIQLTFAKESMRLHELGFYEKSGDKSITKYFNEKINEDLNEELFTKL